MKPNYSLLYKTNLQIKQTKYYSYYKVYLFFNKRWRLLNAEGIELWKNSYTNYFETFLKQFINTYKFS